MMINMSTREAKALVEFIEQNLVAHCCDSEKVDIDSLCDITDVYRRCKELITPKTTGECANDNAVGINEETTASDAGSRIDKIVLQAFNKMADVLKRDFTAEIKGSTPLVTISHKDLSELVLLLLAGYAGY